MFNRKKKNQTPESQASRAQSNIFARLIGCGLLIYVVIQMVRSEDFISGEFWKVAVAVILGLAAAVIIVLTVIEFIRNVKRGVYSSNFYDVKDETQDEEDSGAPPSVE